MAQRGRAYTRHQRAKYITKVKNMVKYIWHYNSYYKWGTDDPETFENLVHGLYKNRHPCSCYMCSTDRKLFGPTLQELKTQTDIDEEFEEWKTLANEMSKKVYES